jgi:hypothetical protein
MTELDDAARKLDLAVQRLEAAARRMADAKPARDKGAAPAQADVTAMVAARLEEAILRIDRLLEE